MDSVKVLSSNLNSVNTRRRYVKQPSFGLNATQAASKVLTNLDDVFNKMPSSYEQRREAKKLIKEGLNKTERFFYKLGKSMGEIQTTLINAVGTALVAPIFIAYNPIAKEDKETRVYSAWRQPVSAVLAVLTQVGINVPFTKYLNKRASEGRLGSFFDLSIKHDSNYLLAQAKKEGIKFANKDMADDYIDKIHVEQFRKEVRKKTKAILNDPEKYTRIFKNTLAPSEQRKMEYFGISVAEEAKKITIKQIKQVEKNVKGLKVVLGLGLSLLTLPPTCSLLNWAYPRFMEIIFPEKCKSQKLKGGK
ncbi:MAG: hypothetical protein A2Y25_11600 [Candidatus Melainabacteria bacterium GWF2_37_15]|nr:MAG: hypothetical protein A2Y25_11600 [Candidatus Melainabacteria bacterium GWF2_37_15]